MSNFTLEAKKREVGAQSLLTNLKDNSRVAAVIYGFKTEPITIEVDYNQLLKVMKGAGTSHTIDLKVDGKSVLTIIRDYQQDPVSDKLRHVDFLAISKDKPLVTSVPIELAGVSKAVKEQGAKLNIKNEKVKVKCLPADLPEKFVIDLSTLSEIGQAIQVGDIQTGPGVKILNNPKDPVVSVVIPKQFIIEEAAPAAGATAEGATAAGATAEGATAAGAIAEGAQPAAEETKGQPEGKKPAAKKS